MSELLELTHGRETHRAWRAAAAGLAALTCLWLASAVGASDATATFTRHELRVGDEVRHYHVFDPVAGRGAARPAVIALHGFESDPGGLRWLIKPDDDAEQFGYLVIYPEAQNKSWNAGRGSGSRNSSSRDLEFMGRLLAVLPERHPVDAQRIYTMGFSNGAQMTALAVCHWGERIAAGAMVAQTLNLECPGGQGTPMAVIHGAKDPFVPLDGGGPYELRSYRSTIEAFAARNGLQEASETVVFDGGTVRCRSLGFEQAGEVVGCVTFSDGHSWPGGVEFQTELFGTTNKELDATSFLFDFFSRHELGGVRSDETHTSEGDGGPDVAPSNWLPRRGMSAEPPELWAHLSPSPCGTNERKRLLGGSE